MHDYEKLGAFYLGRLHDLAEGRTRPDPLLYDSKDLTTHAVCVGMTGSGKTGLCLDLLEEAAIDGIPAIAIDPKGDLGNLMLTFPELRAEDFRPWIDEQEATRRGFSPDQYAADTARRWREGLAAWDQEPERIARFREAVDVSIYTPGSSAGIPLTVLKSFAAPPAALREDSEAYRERISSAVSGLLALLGISADPLRSREHILLSNVLGHAWQSGRDLDLGSMIRDIQEPPFDKLGFLDLETFYPPKDRFELAMSLNNLLASPSFAGWMEGEPLDVKRLLHTSAGKPRLSILSIAHLAESERMFFVTIVLNEILAWMRTQPGTSSLRALLYMDEVFGYFPPTAQPPTKKPMLTMLKQARAYGLGVVLATQNPVDLDYKGLSNTGTWFLGRLQTERDKARVLEGLEGASIAAGNSFDRSAMEATLAGLGSRVFLMNNVHDDEPVVFETRWALSYLRGPLTRSQIQTLMQDREPSEPAPQAAAATPPAAEKLSTSALPKTAKTAKAKRPRPPAGIDEVFLDCPSSEAGTGSRRLVYRPALIGAGRLHFVRATYKVDEWQEIAMLVPIRGEPPEDLWETGQRIDESSMDWEKRPSPDGQFADLPSKLTSARPYKSWATALKDYLYRAETLTIYRCADLKQYSEPGESEGDFRVRLGQLAKEKRDLDVEKLRKKYATKLESLQGRIRTAQQRVEREQSDLQSKTVQSAISLGTSVLGALFGRKVLSTTNVSRAGTAMRGVDRAFRQRSDVSQAQESLETLEDQLKELEQEFQEKVDQVEATLRPDQLELEALDVRPRKSDISVEPIRVVWTPWMVDDQGIAEPAWKSS